MVQPTEMELFICDADGRNLKQLTDLGNANWSPFFHPSGKKILFSSNFESERGFPFNLYMIDIDKTYSLEYSITSSYSLNDVKNIN